MPQLDRRTVKARATRLRAKGAEALNRHLDAWVGRQADALIERDGFARLPDFSTAVFQAADRLEAGGAISLRFTAHDGAHLIGAPA